MYSDWSKASMGSGSSQPQQQAAGPKAQSKEEINAILDDMGARMRRIFESGDAEGLRDFYVDDVIQVIPGVGIVKGRDELVNRAKKEMGTVESMTVEVISREIRDTLVSELCKFRLKLKGMDDEIPGKAMMTYVRDPKDGKWKIKYDMDVPDGPQADATDAATDDEPAASS